MLTTMGRLLVLETAHPVVGAGVSDYSTYRHRPWRRVAHTMTTLQRLAYSDRRGRQKEQQRLDRLHRHIKGTDESGRAYSALDPEARAWVLLTLFEAAVTMGRTGGDPLSPEDERQFYEEWLSFGDLMGLAEQMPPDIEAFWVYFDQMTTEQLRRTKGLLELIEALEKAEFPVPPWLPLPGALWRALSVLGARAYLELTAALLSPKLQERLGLRPSPLGELFAVVFCRGLTIAESFVPERLRYMPIAAAALAARALSPAEEAVPESFARSLDQNGDGTLNWIDLASAARLLSARLNLSGEEENALYEGFHGWWRDLRTRFDTNGDGTLTREEYLASASEPGEALRTAMDAVAAAVDQDDDGYIELSEYEFLLGPGQQALAAAQFHRLDHDGDGLLTRAEFATGLGEFFLGRAAHGIGEVLAEV